ncbi:uncharacterized protein LOC134196722 [Corticium candelabrum]|uniref:uncharacterized protein LOC134196722 n=1 Tax=Corticium candelabrum TaxID=121492 RepID=UPI002E26E3F4|nr:uncharacterized protein LOC134196722 [Corticium candelabrum]
MSKDYFEVPHIGWWLLIFGGLLLNWLVGYKSDVIPYDYILVVGPGLKYLGDNHSQLLQRIFIVALIIHVFEGAYGYTLAKRKKLSSTSILKWSLQSFVLGFPSLMVLRRYDPDCKAKK